MWEAVRDWTEMWEQKEDCRVCFHLPAVPEGRRQDNANASLETIPGRRLPDKADLIQGEKTGLIDQSELVDAISPPQVTRSLPPQGHTKVSRPLTSCAAPPPIKT